MAGELERLLRKAGRELADWQVARFWKIPEEMQQTPCDFIGFTATGRVILIEAKQVKGTSLSLSPKSNGLQPHQYNALDECNRAGGLALLCWAQNGICATLSWDMVLEFSHGRRSVPWRKIPERFLRPLDGSRAHLRVLDAWLPITVRT